MAITLSPLNEALRPAGWFAEFASPNQDDGDLTLMIYRPQGGQAYDRFDFDPANPDDDRPWEYDRFPMTDAIERELFALCRAAQS